MLIERDLYESYDLIAEILFELSVRCETHGIIIMMVWVNIELKLCEMIHSMKQF